jgi:hypothetical protein
LAGGLTVANYFGVSNYDLDGNLLTSVEIPRARATIARDNTTVLWAGAPRGGKELGEVCDGGRLYQQRVGGTPTELTQNVCDTMAMTLGSDADGKPVVYFSERADISNKEGRPEQFRYRVKSLPLPPLEL